LQKYLAGYANQEHLKASSNEVFFEGFPGFVVSFQRFIINRNTGTPGTPKNEAGRQSPITSPVETCRGDRGLIFKSNPLPEPHFKE
jgi:hypothetical protein